MRLDKWLFYARYFKTRALAQTKIDAGQIRVNGARTNRASRLVGAGDVLTFSLGGAVHVLRILSAGTRRGPAPEARTLYDLLSGNTPQDDDPNT